MTTHYETEPNQREVWLTTSTLSLKYSFFNVTGFRSVKASRKVCATNPRPAMSDIKLPKAAAVKQVKHMTIPVLAWTKRWRLAPPSRACRRSHTTVCLPAIVEMPRVTPRVTSIYSPYTTNRKDIWNKHQPRLASKKRTIEETWQLQTLQATVGVSRFHVNLIRFRKHFFQIERRALKS